PLMMDGVLVVQIGAEGGALAGFDPKTGKRLWATCEDKVGYQSPLPYQNDGKRGVLAAGSKKLVFVDPASGKSVWEHEHGGGGARGVASLTPVPAGKDRLFLAHKDEASTAIELARGEDGVTFKSLWEGRSIRNSYNVPVYHDGHVYAYSSRFLTCVDVTTGEPRWRSREPGDGFLILVDGHLVIVTKKGSVHVAKLSTEGYEEVASVDVLDDLAWAHPGFADGHIYVRGLGELAKVAIRRGAVATADEEDELDELVQGTEFGRFLSEVEAAGDKASVVQKFMASQKEFPIIEGDNLVHFVYHGEAEDVAVAGDIFGARQERAMRRVAGTNLFYYSTELEPDARSNYVFIRDYAGMTDPKNDRKTTTKVYTDEMEMSFSGEELEMSWFAMPKWKMAGHLAGGEPGRAGKIESREFESTILAEKKPDDEGTEEEVKPKIEFDVYVPPGYERGSERYPVAYIHSGKDARERGMVREMLDHNIGKDVKPVIAVFINFEPRFGQQGYDRMVVEELIPHVDKAFRTLAAAENRAHYGVGFGGFQALMCAFMHPEAGTKVAAQSPFLFGGMLMGLKASIPEAKKRQMDVYLDWGKYDLRNPHENWDMGEANRDFAKRLKKKGFEIAGGEVHDGTGWSSWRNRVDRVFMALFPA
ncbi:MAG: alpha/beta hydrolase-fold protein, partial [Phycisphaerae bacterium]